MSELPLYLVDGVDAAMQEALASYWIVSAEQVLATAAQEGGVGRLAACMGVGIEQARHVVDVVRSALPPGTATECDQPPVVDHALGVLPPSDESRAKSPESPASPESADPSSVEQDGEDNHGDHLGGFAPDLPNPDTNS